MKDYIYARTKIIEKARAEMLGPGSEGIDENIRCEVISDSPVERYSLGVLFPKNNVYGQDDNERQRIIDNNSMEDDNENADEAPESKKKDSKNSLPSIDNDTLDEEISMANQTMPSAAGLTFFAQGKLEKLTLCISAAKYRISTFKDCIVKIEKAFDPESYLIDEYVYFDNGYMKLKKNINKRKVHELVTDRSISEERPDIVEAFYKLASLCTSEEHPKHTGYVRIPFLENKKIELLLDNEISKLYIDEEGEINTDRGCIKITVLKKEYRNNIFSYTVVMTNEYEGRANYKNCFFQPQIKVSTEDNNFIFIEKSQIDHIHNKYMDESDLIFNILYRNKKSFAVGHGTATGQNVDMNTGRGEVFTDFFPTFEIPQLDFEIEGLGEESSEILSMFNLSDLSSIEKSNKIELLRKFAEAYEKWINNQEKLGQELKDIYQPKIIDDLINKCNESLKRVKKGIEILNNNECAYNAFTFMNRAMLMQRVHSKYTGSEYDRFPGDKDKPITKIDYLKIEKKAASWRAFQLAFILINIESISNPESEERDLVDLIWIPTGGGKTEAYLGLSAFTIFHRRLTDPNNGGGTAIIMRYTLRLLASQQFIRASILICACEKMRREINSEGKFNLGNDEISIGLWVGGDPTPNTNKQAKEEFTSLTKATKTKEELDENKRKHNKFQVLKCPWCGTKLEIEYEDGKKKGVWGYEYKKKNIIFCPEPKCDFKAKLPIQVVDEELYKNPPTLLFGTVDKFAMLPWKGEISNLFALNKTS